MKRQRLLLIALTMALPACGQNTLFHLPGTASAVDDAATGGSQTPDTPDCTAFKASLPATVTQATIEVPENWDNPSGLQIKVFYYYTTAATFTAGSTSQPRTNVAFFNGGPASDSHSSYPVLRPFEAQEPLRFIYIDQRGTGCSDHYPQGDTQDIVNRLLLYGSRSIVKDAEAIRKKMLGEDVQWHVFGQSYGSLIVHRYLEVAPQGIDAAYAHGFAAISDSLKLMTLRVEADGKVGPRYLADNPGDADLLTKIRGLIPASQCYGADKAKICGPAMVDGVANLLGFHDIWPDIHQLLTELISADGSLSAAALSYFATTTVLAEASPDALVAGDVIGNMEATPGLYSLQDPTGCLRVNANISKDGLDPTTWPFDECRLSLAMQADSSDDPTLDQETLQLPSDPLNLPAIQASLTQYPNLKYFLYAGDLDSFVPPAVYAEEVAQLGNRITYREFPNSGHDGFYDEAQIRADLVMPASGTPIAVPPGGQGVPAAAVAPLPTGTATSTTIGTAPAAVGGQPSTITPVTTAPLGTATSTVINAALAGTSG